MNSTLKSSTLVPLNNQPEKAIQHPLALIKSTNKLDQPNQQQKQAISQIYVEQARIYFQEKNWGDAIAACKNALEVNSQNADAYRIFGNILKIKGKKAEALGVYAKALEMNPNSAPVYANLGSFYAEQKNWQQALDYYQQAVIIDPRLAGAYRSLAQVWEELGDSQQALECLCQAVNLEPEKLPAAEYFSFGDRLYAEGKLKEASIFYTHGVELNPQAEKELAQLVKILEELEEWQQAVIFYHRLMSLSGGESPQQGSTENKPIRNLLSKSRTRSRTKTQPQAVKQSPKAISPSPTTPPPKLFPKLDSKSGNTVQSLGAAKQPNSAISWNNLGSSYGQKKQWLKAISCYQEAIQLNPKLGKTYRNLARVYLKIDKKNQAMLCWYEAFNLEPNLVKPEEHFRLAQRLLQLQETDKAIACLRNATKLNPNFDQASLVLGKLLHSQGKTDEAQACYEKVKSSKGLVK